MRLQMHFRVNLKLLSILLLGLTLAVFAALWLALRGVEKL
jgi:hypothetical protein